MSEAGNSPANYPKPSSYHYHPIPPDLRELAEELETLGGGDTRIGRLEVVCRIAPQSTRPNVALGADTSTKASALVAVEGSSVVLRDPRTPSAEATKTRFPVSTAHGASDEDATVGASISSGPLDWLWEGFNGTIMAMGAQGSGKTHTLFAGRVGPNSCGGAVGSLLTELFQRTRAAADLQPRGQPAHAVVLSVWEVRPGAAAEPVVDLLKTAPSAATTEGSNSTAGDKQGGRAATQRGSFASVECASASEAFAVLYAACSRSRSWAPTSSTHKVGQYDDARAVENYEAEGPAKPVLVAQRNASHLFVRITLVELTGHKSFAALHVVDLAGRPSSMEWARDATAAASSSSSSSMPLRPSRPSQGYTQAEATRREIAQGLSALERVLAELGQSEEAQMQRIHASGGKTGSTSSSQDLNGRITSQHSGGAATRALTCARETLLTRICGPLLCGNGKTWLIACVAEGTAAGDDSAGGGGASSRQATQHTLSSCLKASSVCAACQRVNNVDLAAMNFEPASKALVRLQPSYSSSLGSVSGKASSEINEMTQEDPSSEFDWTAGGASHSGGGAAVAAVDRRPPSPLSSEEEGLIESTHGNGHNQGVHSHLVSEDDVRRSVNDSLDGSVMPLQAPTDVMHTTPSLLAKPQKPSRILANTSGVSGASGTAADLAAKQKVEERGDEEKTGTTSPTTSESGLGSAKMATIQTEIARVVESLLPPHSRNSPTPPPSPNPQPWSKLSPSSSPNATEESGRRPNLGNLMDGPVPGDDLPHSGAAREGPSSPAPVSLSLLDLADEPLEDWTTRANAQKSSAPSISEQVENSSSSEGQDLTALFLSSFGSAAVDDRSDANAARSSVDDGVNKSTGVITGGASIRSRSVNTEAGADKENEEAEDGGDVASNLRVPVEGNDNNDEDEEYMWPTSPVADVEAAMGATTPRAFHAVNHSRNAEEGHARSGAATNRAAAPPPSNIAFDLAAKQQENEQLEDEAAASSVREESLRLENMHLLRKCRALEGALSQAQRQEAQRARAKEPLPRGTTPPLPAQPQPPPLPTPRPRQQLPVNRDEHPVAPPPPTREAANTNSNKNDVDRSRALPRSVVHETITKETRARNSHASSVTCARSTNSAQVKPKKKKPWGAAEPSGKVPLRAAGGDVHADSLREDLQRARRRADIEGARADKAQGRVVVLENELASVKQSAQKRSVEAAQQVCARLQARLNDALTQAEARSAALTARDVQVLRLEAALADATARATKAEAQASRSSHDAKSLSILCQQLRQVAVQTHAQDVGRPALVEKFVGKHHHHGKPPPPPAQAGAVTAGESAQRAVEVAGLRITPPLPAATARVDASLARLASVVQKSSSSTTTPTNQGGSSSSGGSFDQQWLDTVQRSVRQVQGGLRRHPDCTSLLEVAGRVETMAVAAAKQQARREAALVDVLTALLDERGDDTSKVRLQNAFKGSESSSDYANDGSGARDGKQVAVDPNVSMMPTSRAAVDRGAGRERRDRSAAVEQQQQRWRRDHHMHRSLDDPRALRHDEGPRVRFQTSNGGDGHISTAGNPTKGSEPSSKVAASNFLRRSADAAMPVHPLPAEFLEAAALRARRNMP